MPRPRIPKESPVYDESGRWTRTWIMYFESLFDLSVAEAVRLAATKQGDPGLSTSVFPYRADTSSTTAADPGKGKIRWNNATQASATNLYFDWLTSAGFDITALMEVMDAPDRIIIQDTDLALNHQVWELTGPVVMMPDWFIVPVTFISSSGSGVFSHNQPVSVLVPVGGGGSGGGTGAPFRTGHTFALVGDVSAITSLPSMFVPLRSGQAASIVGLRADLVSGTSVGVQVKRNGANVGSVITVTTTTATTSLSQALSDGDELTLVLSSPVGSPTGLGATLILEQTP